MRYNKSIGDVELGRAPVIAAVLTRLSGDAVTRAKADGADIIELRLDLLNAEERREADIKSFLEGCNMPVILTNRCRDEGGSFTGTEYERIEMLRTIIATGLVDAVDIEFIAESKKDVIETAKRVDIPVIISLHDFSGMPAPDEILEIVEAMYSVGGSIAKVAVTPMNRVDCLNLIQITEQISREGRALITIGMGDWGRHLRVIAPLYGSVLTYGFIEEDRGAVAPGQFSVSELKSMLERLKPSGQ